MKMAQQQCKIITGDKELYLEVPYKEGKLKFGAKPEQGSPMVVARNLKKRGLKIPTPDEVAYLYCSLYNARRESEDSFCRTYVDNLCNHISSAGIYLFAEKDKIKVNVEELNNVLRLPYSGGYTREFYMSQTVATNPFIEAIFHEEEARNLLQKRAMGLRDKAEIWMSRTDEEDIEKLVISNTLENFCGGGTMLCVGPSHGFRRDSKSIGFGIKEG